MKVTSNQDKHARWQHSNNRFHCLGDHVHVYVYVLVWISRCISHIYTLVSCWTHQLNWDDFPASSFQKGISWLVYCRLFLFALGQEWTVLFSFTSHSCSISPGDSPKSMSRRAALAPSTRIFWGGPCRASYIKNTPSLTIGFILSTYAWQKHITLRQGEYLYITNTTQTCTPPSPNRFTYCLQLYCYLIWTIFYFPQVLLIVLSQAIN